MKRCGSCLLYKPKSNFGKRTRAKDGLREECKDCRKIESEKWRHSKEGLIQNIYNNQKQNSKHRGHKTPDYTLSELRIWCFSQSKFHVLFKNWEENGYNKKLTPSIDRLDDYLGYDFSNIQIVTWKENTDKYHRDRKIGKNNKQNKAVLQFTLNGVFVKEWFSIAEASRNVDRANKAHIVQCCKGKKIQTAGYKWEYK